MASPLKKNLSFIIKGESQYMHYFINNPQILSHYIKKYNLGKYTAKKIKNNFFYASDGNNVEAYFSEKNIDKNKYYFYINGKVNFIFLKNQKFNSEVLLSFKQIEKNLIFVNMNISLNFKSIILQILSKYAYNIFIDKINNKINYYKQDAIYISDFIYKKIKKGEIKIE